MSTDWDERANPREKYERWFIKTEPPFTITVDQKGGGWERGLTIIGWAYAATLNQVGELGEEDGDSESAISVSNFRRQR